MGQKPGKAGEPLSTGGATGASGRAALPLVLSTEKSNEQDNHHRQECHHWQVHDGGEGQQKPNGNCCNLPAPGGTQAEEVSCTAEPSTVGGVPCESRRFSRQESLLACLFTKAFSAASASSGSKFPASFCFVTSSSNRFRCSSGVRGFFFFGIRPSHQFVDRSAACRRYQQASCRREPCRQRQASRGANSETQTLPDSGASASHRNADRRRAYRA